MTLNILDNDKLQGLTCKSRFSLFTSQGNCLAFPIFLLFSLTINLMYLHVSLQIKLSNQAKIYYNSPQYPFMIDTISQCRVHF